MSSISIGFLKGHLAFDIFVRLAPLDPNSRKFLDLSFFLMMSKSMGVIIKS